MSHYIVQFPSRAAAQAYMRGAGESLVPQDRVLSNPDAGWVRAELSAKTIEALRAQGAKVFPDRKISIPPHERHGKVISPRDLHALVNSETRVDLPTHGADKLQAEGYTGSRVGICIVDTGIGDNPDVKKPTKFDNVYTAAPLDPNTDPHGHGTFCASEATGTGKNIVLGMAPGARLYGAEVLNKQGQGSWSSVMKGIDDAIKWSKDYPDKPFVVSLSLGGPASKLPKDDPLVQKIEQATKQYGILFCIAAGNSGPGQGTVGTPGDTKDAVTVGAMDTKHTVTQNDDTIASFSSRGLPDGSKGQVVNIAASGVQVLGGLPGGKYARWSGTSMATPNVAGAAALLLDKAQDLYDRGQLSMSPRDMVKQGIIQQLLYDSANDHPDIPATAEGAGELRVDRAAQLLVQRYGKGLRVSA